MRRLLAIAGAAALMFAAAELAARALLRWRESRTAAASSPLAHLPVYDGVPWAADYWREWRAAVQLPERMQYRGEGILHLAPFHGRAIDVGTDGHRRTTHSDCRPGSLQIAMFGGSMLWGHGVSDELTIPSQIAARYEAAGTPACVENFGEWGANTSNAVHELVRELARGRHFDLVVFYSGSYDVKESLFGSEWDEWLREKDDAPSLALIALLRSRESSTRTASARFDPLPRYRLHRDALEALGARFAFTPLFFWHPYILAGAKPMTAHEQETIRRFDAGYPVLANAIRSTYRAMEQETHPGFYNLAHTFDGHRELLFLDAGHLAPDGNRIIAGRMYEIMRTARTTR